MFSPHPLELSGLHRALSVKEAGALVCFEGRVRSTSPHGEVVSIDYEAYEELSVREFERIEQETRAQFGILDIRCVHRTGTVSSGEPAVWAGVLAIHRREAFQACEHIVNELKARLPIWKKEIYADGNSRWIDYSQG
ncbi:MAG TPA: molybdopterin-converting factor chain 2 [Verrucomicrobia bacterium]|nr:MAG: hypothetical protein A2X46_08090 [Lentisphaerae bacterium GWF2_57_35]HBA84592.1 molybdopterin-converting factor chain 2 [Verrucomicrobiota bacterium]